METGTDLIFAPYSGRDPASCKALQRIVRESPGLGRLGDREDVADAVIAVGEVGEGHASLVIIPLC